MSGGRVDIYMRKEEKEAAKEYAEREGISLSELIRVALKDFMDTEKNEA